MSEDFKSQFAIRDYRESDYPEVEKLWFETGLNDPKRGDTGEVILTTIRQGGKFLVMFRRTSGEIVGTSWMTFDGRRIHLHHCGIKSELQNRSLGKWLTLESLKFAKENKQQIKLEVHRDNKRAVHLYQSLGFKYLGDYDVYIIRDPDQLDLS